MDLPPENQLRVRLNRRCNLTPARPQSSSGSPFALLASLALPSCAGAASPLSGSVGRERTAGRGSVDQVVRWQAGGSLSSGFVLGGGFLKYIIEVCLFTFEDVAFGVNCLIFDWVDWHVLAVE